jgi:CMP-N,N'-diacetyllegionaminic acid synthase
VAQKQSDLLILIPARSGSKSIPNKNTTLLLGESLLSWTAKVAIDSQLSKNVVLSTDSNEIAQLGRELGLNVPFIRPKDLAQDRTLQLEVIKHTVAVLSENFNMKFDSIMLLQPTSPFRSRESIVKSYNYFCEYNADTLITISDISKFAPSTKYLAEKSLLPDLFQLESLSNEIQKQSRGTLRQDFEQVWWRNGSIYIFKTTTLINSNSLYGGKTVGMPINSVESINIDTSEDLALAKIVAKGIKNL